MEQEGAVGLELELGHRRIICTTVFWWIVVYFDVEK
jgi:hypothetical protein